MSTIVTVRCNTGNNDVAYPSGEWVNMDLDNDKLIWTDGNVAVADGEDTPTDSELNESSPLVPDSSPYEIPKTFLLDFSEVSAELKEIVLAGSGDNRYVFCFYFDGLTATEPTLEAWDDDSHITNDYECLGAGAGANSYIKVVRTTDGSPGAGWTGDPISGSSNKSQMNGGAGALGGATTIYYNIKVVIPVGATPASEQPVLAVRYTWL